MAKKYWEEENPETVEFGIYFMSCYEKAGKLQFGVKINGNRIVKFVLDRDAFIGDDQAPGYLRQLITDWEEARDDGA